MGWERAGLMRVDDKTRRRRLVAAMLFAVLSTTGYALLVNWDALALSSPAFLSL